MDRETKILKSYSKVWKIERTFYQIGGFNLPSPVALNTIIYFLVFAIVMFLARNMLIISLIPDAFKYLFIPGGIAWLCSNKLLDGKNPLSFVLSIVTHYLTILVKGYRINRYKYIDSKGTAKYTTKISYRILTKLESLV